MKAYAAFVSKEWMECIRTYKLLIVGILSVLFGITNPVFAKITPDLLASLMPEGMEITMAEPTALDAWMQFYKNMGGLQIIVFVILFGGIMSGEFSKDTLILMLTKSMRRQTVLFAKLTVMLGVWTLSYALCYGVTYGYTLYLLPGDPLPNIVRSAVYLWLFGIFILSALLFFGVLCKKIFGALLLTGGYATAWELCSFIPHFCDYNPYRLCSENVSLLNGTLAASDCNGAVILTIVLTLMTMVGTVLCFQRKQL